MKCVKCEGKLATVRVDDIDVDQCTTCGGIWFDAHELERVLKRRKVDALLGRGAPRSDDDERRGRCPRCKSEGYLVRMASKRATVHVDTCAVCGGKWLDGGELDALRREGLAGRVRRIVDFILDLDLG